MYGNGPPRISIFPYPPLGKETWSGCSWNSSKRSVRVIELFRCTECWCSSLQARAFSISVRLAIPALISETMPKWVENSIVTYTLVDRPSHCDDYTISRLSELNTLLNHGRKYRKNWWDRQQYTHTALVCQSHFVCTSSYARVIPVLTFWSFSWRFL